MYARMANCVVYLRTYSPLICFIVLDAWPTCSALLCVAALLQAAPTTAHYPILLFVCVFAAAGCSDADISASIASFQSARAPHAATINVLANALHCVFTRPVDDASGTRARLRVSIYSV